jgi:hypothetical protein
LKLWNNQNRTLIKELNFASNIDCCQWTKSHVAVLVEKEIRLFDLRSLSLRVVLPRHPLSPCMALTHWEEDESRYLVFPSTDDAGMVSVFDCVQQKLLNKFRAHRTPVAAMQCDQRGRQVATASNTGTIVRVFAVPTGHILFSFRIAALSMSAVQAFSFCPLGHYLVVRSANNTLSLCPLFHKLMPREKKQRQQQRRQQMFRAGSGGSVASEEGVDLAVCEEDDGFCRIDVETTADNDDLVQGIEYYDDNDNDSELGRQWIDEDVDDGLSVLTDDRSTFSRGTRIDTVHAPSSATIQQQQSFIPFFSPAVSSAVSDTVTGLLDNGAQTLSSWWSLAHTQNLIDATLAGIQQVKNVSQDIFALSDDQHGEISTNAAATVRVELDRVLRRPILQINCRNDQSSDVFVSLSYSATATTAGQFDCNEVSPDHESILSAAPSRQQQQQQQQQEMSKELCLTVATRAGLFRK